MPKGFFRSDKGVAEYKRIGKEYPNTMDDDRYVKYLRRNANSPHSARNKIELHTLVRELANDGKEYLVWSMRDVMYSPLGGEDPFFRTGLGKYPIPITRPSIVLGENMQTSEVVTGDVIRDDIGYEKPYTRENIEALHEYAMDYRQQGKTQYIVRRIGGRKITIPKYEDFRDGDFEDLEKNGKITLLLTTSQEEEKQKHSRK